MNVYTDPVSGRQYVLNPDGTTSWADPPATPPPAAAQSPAAQPVDMHQIDLDQIARHTRPDRQAGPPQPAPHPPTQLAAPGAATASKPAAGSDGPGHARPVLLGAGIVVALIAGIAIGHNTDGPDSTVSALPPIETTHKVGYELDGTARSADITYTTPSGMGQQQGVDVPLTLKNGTLGIQLVMSDGAVPYISAQNTGSGSITCRILVDGAVVAENTSHGEFAIATCQTSL